MQLIKNTIVSLVLAAVVSAGGQQGSASACPDDKLAGVCYLKVVYTDKTETTASAADIGAYDMDCNKMGQKQIDTKDWNVTLNLTTMGSLEVTKGTDIKGFNFKYGHNGHFGDDVYVNTTTCYQKNHCWVRFNC